MAVTVFFGRDGIIFLSNLYHLKKIQSNDGICEILSGDVTVFFLRHAINMLSGAYPALRVAPAETRLTVYLILCGPLKWMLV